MSYIKKIMLSVFFVSISTISIASVNNINPTNFSQLYFFGDSLTDTGNRKDKPAIGTKPGASPTWAVTFSERYGRKDDSNDLRRKGNNYAVDGETTSQQLARLNNFLNEEKGQIDRKALYSIWVGPNDVFEGLRTFDPEKVAQKIIEGTDNITAMTNNIDAAGGRFIMVMNLPDLSKTYIAQRMTPGMRKDIRTATEAFNRMLLSKIENTNANVIQIDIFSIFNYLFENHSEFEIANVSGKCDRDVEACNRYLYYDLIHPSFAVQKIISDYAYSVFTAPAFAFSLTQAPISTLKAQNQVIQQQFYPAHQGNNQRRVFIGGNYSPKNETYYQGSGKDAIQEGKSHNLTLGYLFPLNNKISAGVALGYSETNTDLNRAPILGKFDHKTFMVSLFGNYINQNFYVNSILNTGLLNYSNIQRRYNLGPRETQANADTRGSQYGVHLGTGYLFVNNDKWQTGPIANVDYQHVRVKGYTEHSVVTGTAIMFDDQKYNSFVTGLGWQLGFKHKNNIADWLANFTLSANRQWQGGEHNVNFRLASLPGAKYSYLPVNVPKLNFVNAGVNISAILNKKVTLSLGYNAQIGEKNMREHYVNAGVSIALE